MKRPDRVRDATDHLISSPGAAARVVGYIESLEAENDRLRAALRIEHDHYCDATFNRCLGCEAAEKALNGGKE